MAGLAGGSSWGEETDRMTTLVIMLLLLGGPTVGNALIERATGRSPLGAATAGCLGIALVFCFAGIGHFVRTEAMAEMMPPWVPARVPLVYATGVLEFVVAAAVLVPRVRLAAGVTILLLLVVFLPVNVYAALNRVDMGGHEWGPVYLLVRVPMQLLMIAWVWWYAVRQPERARMAEGRGDSTAPGNPE
jgi:uncharacterized membrane protein